MGIVAKKPPMKESVGAQYICFNTPTEDNSWNGTYEEEVEQTKVVKSVKVTENSEVTDVYASGEVYDSDATVSKTDVEVQVIAFPADTLARMRGETVDAGGLHLTGGRAERPFFAYGKVVKLRNGKERWEWFPKCKLAENTDEITTREDKFSEQPDTITISAYGFNDKGDSRAYVDSSSANFPEKLTEALFFAKPILTPADLAAAVSTE